MIWQRKDPAQNHFVTFDHQQKRIAALEFDLNALCEDLLTYIEAHRASPWRAPAERLAETARKILDHGQRPGRDL